MKLEDADRAPEDWTESIPAESVCDSVSLASLGGSRDGTYAQDDPKEKKEIEFALNNFAILAIRPVAVEFLELKPTPNRRTQWRKQGDEWIETKVCP